MKRLHHPRIARLIDELATVRSWCWIAFTACVCLLLLDARQLVKAQFGVAQREGYQLRLLAHRDLLDARRDLLSFAGGQLSAMGYQVTRGMDEVHRTVTLADRRTSDALGEFRRLRQGVLAQTAPVMQQAAVALPAARGNLDTLTAAYARVPEDFKFATRWLWDCQAYSGCLQSQTLGLAGSARHTLGSMARASDRLPHIAERFDVFVDKTASIADTMKTATDKFFAPVPWYKKLYRTGELVGAGIIRLR